MIATVGMLLALSLQQVTGTLQESMYLRNADDTTNTVMGKSMVTAALMNAGTLSGEGSSQQPASTEMQEVEAVVPAEEPVTAGVNAADPALTNLLVPPLAPPLNVDDECDEDKLKCVSGVCMCLTPGRLVGFVPAMASPPPRPVRKRWAKPVASQAFVQLFMPTLPGTDITEIRRLWEFITGLASESMTMREEGSVRSQRTAAYARPCGDASSRHVDPLPPSGKCQRVKRATDDAPTLITMLEDMTRPGHRKLVEWKSVDASVQVYVVRNPLDHYTAYIKELDELEPIMPMLLSEALANEALHVQVAGSQLSRPLEGTPEPTDADANTAQRVSQGHVGGETGNAQGNGKGRRQGSSRKLLRKKGGALEAHPSNISHAGVDAPRGGKAGPIAGALWPQRDFQSWFAYQWLPYVRSITAPQYAHKQKFVIKYEELMEDPSGVIWDFLVSTGVAEKLGISRRILRAFEKKSLNKNNKKLVDLDKTGDNFDGLTKKYGDPLLIDSTAVTALYMPANAESLTQFGYHFWQEDSELSMSLRTIEEPEKQERKAALKLVEQLGSQVHENTKLYEEVSKDVKRNQISAGKVLVMLLLCIGSCIALRLVVLYRESSKTADQDRSLYREMEKAGSERSEKNIYLELERASQRIMEQVGRARSMCSSWLPPTETLSNLRMSDLDVQFRFMVSYVQRLVGMQQSSQHSRSSKSSGPEYEWAQQQMKAFNTMRENRARAKQGLPPK
eukprot:CAMPEP_0114231882 /NCGR_PEP_ID=MMETSP0058-20121206/4299_1 /TAXON_ID=36894 /ORGANISM="Pyramimonas parkeae, CCMP726" /LENGTH=732 /DNA_ID=CAMNT_0001343297 /DNA_START=571 /DNA_END=2769 /DNA_ORIENTATION=-